MPKSFLIRNSRRDSMTVSTTTTKTTCDPTWNLKDMKPFTDSQHLSSSTRKVDLGRPLDLHAAAYDDLQSSNSPTDDAIEPLNLSCRSGCDLRRDSSTNSEDVGPLDLSFPSEYHKHRSGLSKPKEHVGMSTGVRSQCHSSIDNKVSQSVEKKDNKYRTGEEGAAEGTQPHQSITSLHQMYYQREAHNANHDTPRRPGDRHPPLDSFLRQNLESRINEGNFFSNQLVACKLRSPIQRTYTSKRHCCLFCSKQFNDKFDLKRHTRTHTGVRPFKCGRCFRAFTQRCSLEIHQRKIHRMELSFAFKERRDKIYVCEHCGHSTDEINTHYAHTVQKHQGQSHRFPGVHGQVVSKLASGSAVGIDIPGGFSCYQTRN